MRIRALLLSSKMRKMRQKERQDKTRDSRFSTTKKKTTIKFDASSGACATKPRKSLRLVSSFTRHVVFDFIRFSFVSLSLSFTLARFFQNRDDDDDAYCDDDDFSLVLFREDAGLYHRCEREEEEE